MEEQRIEGVHKKRFYYRYTNIRGTAALLTILAGIYIACMIAFDEKSTKAEIWQTEIFFIPLLVYVALLFLNAFIRTSDIIIDDLGVRYLVLGKERNKITWDKVKRVRIWQNIKFITSKTPMYGYTLDQTTDFRLPYTKKPPLMFTDEIENLPELLETLNGYIQKHNIPVLDHRQKPPVSLTRL